MLAVRTASNAVTLKTADGALISRTRHLLANINASLDRHHRRKYFAGLGDIDGITSSNWNESWNCTLGTLPWKYIILSFQAACIMAYWVTCSFWKHCTQSHGNYCYLHPVGVNTRTKWPLNCSFLQYRFVSLTIANKIATELFIFSIPTSFRMHVCQFWFNVHWVFILVFIHSKFLQNTRIPTVNSALTVRSTYCIRIHTVRMHEFITYCSDAWVHHIVFGCMSSSHSVRMHEFIT